MAELIMTTKALTKHMEHLPKIANGIETMIDKISEANSTLLSAAIGKEQIPLDTANEMFAQQNKNNAILYRVFGAICFALLAVIGYLLMGEHYGWIRHLNG